MLFIHLTLCLLIGLFNSFTFSVVIDIVIFTSAILLFIFYISEYFLVVALGFNVHIF